MLMLGLSSSWQNPAIMAINTTISQGQFSPSRCHCTLTPIRKGVPPEPCVPGLCVEGIYWMYMYSSNLRITAAAHAREFEQASENEESYTVMLYGYRRHDSTLR